MKKWIAALLACLMALLPVFSFADSDSPIEKLLEKLDDGKQELVINLTMTSGEALSNGLIKALMDSVSARVNVREDLASLTLLIDGGETLQAQARKASSGMYALCNAIGTDIYFLTGGQNAAVTAPVSALVETDELKPEKLAQSTIHEIFTKMVDGDAEMLAWYDGVLATATTEKGEFVTETTDPAIAKLTVPLTAETLKAALNTNYVKEKLTDEQEDMTNDQAAAKAQELIDDMNVRLDKSELSATVTCLLTEKDIPVSLAIEMHRKHTGDDGTQTPLTEQVQVDKKTIQGATQLTGSALQQVDGKAAPSITATGAVLINAKGDAIDFDLAAQGTAKSGTAKGTLAKSDTGLTGTVALAFTEDGKTTTINADGVLNVTETGLNGVAALSMNGSTMGKLNVVGELTAPTATFDQLLAATPESCIQPDSMSTAERAQLTATIQSNAMIFALTMMSKLPASVSSAVMTMLFGK